MDFLKRCFSRSRARTPRGSQQNQRLAIERLEGRYLLAGDAIVEGALVELAVSDAAVAVEVQDTCFDHLITDGSTEFSAPAVPLPGYLEPFIDPIFGTRVIRVTDPGNAIPGLNQTWESVARHHYSVDQAWNADQTLLMLDRGTSGGSLFLDGNSYEPLFIREAPGRYRWHPTVPDLQIFVNNNQIGTWNVHTEEVNVIATLDGYSGFDLGPNKGSPSNDGTKIAVAGFNATGQQVAFAYDLQAHQKYPDILLPPGADLVTISPLGTYVVVHGDLEAADQTQVYDLQGNTVGPLWSEYHRPGHFDLTVDENGDEVAVGRSKSDPDAWLVIKRRLSDGAVTVLTDAGASHTSARNLQRPGWAYLSYSSSGVYQYEVVAVKLDGSMQVERLVHTHTAPNGYLTEQHASPSPDGTKVIFASNWDDPDGNIAAYVVELCPDPSATLPSVSIAATDAVATEAGDDTARFTVSRTGDTSEELSLLYALYSVSGTATNGIDYHQLDGAVTIPAGATTAFIEIVPVDDPFAEPMETVTIELSPAASYTLGASTSDTVTIADDDATDQLFVVESRVSASSDDAEESASGSMSLGSSDLELVEESSTQQVGMRFNGIDIPQAATITKAYLQFTVDETTSLKTTLTVQGQAVGDAPTFSSSRYDISSRSRTEASVSWSPGPWRTKHEAGPDQQTGDLAPVIQEIINRPDWSRGNSLAIIITGSGKRVAESYDGDQNGAPLLHVEYTTGNTRPPAENQPPVLEPIGDRSVAVGSELTFTAAASDPNRPADTLTFSLDAGAPTGAGIDPVTGVFVWTPAADDGPGNYPVTVRVTDDGSPELSDFETITITVFETGGGNVIRVPFDQPTIQAAIDTAHDGDVVLVSPGTYNERLTLSAKTITVASEFFTTGDNAFIEQTIIDGWGSAVITVDPSVGPETKIVGFTIQGGSDGISAYAKLEILNNHFVDNGDAIDFEAGGGIVRNNLFENNSDDAIDLDGPTEAIIENNVIRNNDDDGIEIRLHGYSGPTLNIVIRNNTISGNGEDGIQLIGYPDNSDRFFLIEGNLFQGNALVGLGLMDNGETGEDFRAASIPDPIRVFNNTFVDNPYSITGGDNLVALNNLFVGSVNTATKEVDGGSILAYNLFWNNGTDNQGSNLDPGTTLLVDPLLNSNNELQAGSPAIDAGTAHFEFDGQVVLDLPASAYSGAAPDLGAYESDFAQDNTPPTTTGIADTTVAEDDPAQVVDLFAAFDDLEDADANLAYTVQSNSNPGLFSSTDIDGVAGTLTLAFSPDANGMAELTVRATDTGTPPLFVEASFTVRVTAVNDAPVLVAGEIGDPTVVADSGTTSLGLSGLAYGPGGGSDESGQTLSYAVTAIPNAALGDVVLADGSTVVAVGAYTLADIQGMQFRTAAGGGAGSGTFGFMVTDDGTPNLSELATITITVNDDGGGVTTVESRVSAASDDAEESGSGKMILNGSDLQLANGGSNQKVGIRFTGVDIPPAAAITRAYIQFTVDKTTSAETALVIQGQALGDASTFSSSKYDISSRIHTAASVSWSPAPWTGMGDSGPDQQTPDLAPVIQEIVNRPDWLRGNALAIIITGSGKRIAESYDGDQNGAALLHVEYTTAALLTVDSSFLPPDHVEQLTNEQLSSTLEAAIVRLVESGVPQAAEALAGVTVDVVDLPGNLLGRTSAARIEIDRDAAGYGWFIDVTPQDDREFSYDTPSNQLVAWEGSPAEMRVDLLTTIMHELGHRLAYEHTDSESLMDATLPLGTRRLLSEFPDILPDESWQQHALDIEAADTFFDSFNHTGEKLPWRWLF